MSLATGQRVGGGVLAAAAVTAAVLGMGGLRHPGPIGQGGFVAAAAPASTSQAAAAAATSSRSARGSGASGQTGSHAAAGGASGSASGASGSSAAGSSAAAQSTLRPTTMKLSQSPYAAYAVSVYPSRDAFASQALDGFTLRVTPAGPGTLRVVVNVVGAPPGQPAYSQVIARGDHVYFLEGSMGDDATGQDVNFGDDGVIITNQRGYILQ